MKKKMMDSILVCPSCERDLINIGNKVERVHPIPRFLQKNYGRIILVSGVSTTGAMIFMGPVFNVLGGRIIGFIWVLSFFFPIILSYFLIRAFPIYRVIDCPFCGYHEEIRLGRSSISC